MYEAAKHPRQLPAAIATDACVRALVWVLEQVCVRGVFHVCAEHETRHGSSTCLKEATPKQ